MTENVWVYVVINRNQVDDKKRCDHCLQQAREESGSQFEFPRCWDAFYKRVDDPGNILYQESFWSSSEYAKC